MNKYKARKLAQYHKFTKIELYNILKESLETLDEEYWKKPNKINLIFDNGYYFNRCVEWLGYEKGVNDNDLSAEIIVVRILEVFGKFSKTKLPVKKKPSIKIQASETPKLITK